MEVSVAVEIATEVVDERDDPEADAGRDIVTTPASRCLQHPPDVPLTVGSRRW